MTSYIPDFISDLQACDTTLIGTHRIYTYTIAKRLYLI